MRASNADVEKVKLWNNFKICKDDNQKLSARYTEGRWYIYNEFGNHLKTVGNSLALIKV